MKHSSIPTFGTLKLKDHIRVAVREYSQNRQTCDREKHQIHAFSKLLAKHDK